MNNTVEVARYMQMERGSHEMMPPKKVPIIVHQHTGLETRALHSHRQVELEHLQKHSDTPDLNFKRILIRYFGPLIPQHTSDLNARINGDKCWTTTSQPF